MVSDLKVGDVMTKKVIVLNIGENLAKVAQVMQKHSIGSVIVVDEKNRKKAVGLLTERDIVYKVIAKSKNPYKTNVSAIMSRPLKVVKPETSLEEAARLMKDNRIKRLPVVNDQHELVGILSEGDIMRIFPAIVDIIEERTAARE